MRKINTLVIHCSASADGDARTTYDTIDRAHRERGWKGIGYHYVIHVDGYVYGGRALSEIGAHVQGSNADSIGICMIGTARFTPEQWGSLRDLVSNLEGQFPGVAVCGHRDYSPDLNGDGLIEEREWFKLCPGFDVGAWRAAGMDPLWSGAHVV